MLSSPLPLPVERAVYVDLSTDHYPWTEVAADLAARQAQGFSGAFDAVQGERWARFVWARGLLLGGYTRDGLEVSWLSGMQAMPRARISLLELPPAAAQVVFTCRSVVQPSQQGVWPDLRPVLERQQFYGLLVSGQVCSLWASGRVVGGLLPPAGATCQLYSAHAELSRDDQVKFWQDLFFTVNRSVPLDQWWAPAILRLSEEFSSLDPFAQEITLQAGHLRIDPHLPVSEFRPALQATLKSMLARAGVRLHELHLGDLRSRPEWAVSGLESA